MPCSMFLYSVNEAEKFSAPCTWLLYCSSVMLKHQMGLVNVNFMEKLGVLPSSVGYLVGHPDRSGVYRQYSFSVAAV